MLIRSLFALIESVFLLLVPVAALSEGRVHCYLLAVVFSTREKVDPTEKKHWWIDLVICIDFF